MSDNLLRQYEHELRRQGRQVRVLPVELVERIELELTYQHSQAKRRLEQERRRGALTSAGQHVERFLLQTLDDLHAHIPADERDAIRSRVTARMREFAADCTASSCTPDNPNARCCGVAAVYDLSPSRGHWPHVLENHNE
jgi:hypothetical protein